AVGASPASVALVSAAAPASPTTWRRKLFLHCLLWVRPTEIRRYGASVTRHDNKRREASSNTLECFLPRVVEVLTWRGGGGRQSGRPSWRRMSATWTRRASSSPRSPG